VQGLRCHSRNVVHSTRRTRLQSLLLALCLGYVVGTCSCQKDSPSSARSPSSSSGLPVLLDSLMEQHGPEKARQLLRAHALSSIAGLEQLEHFSRFPDVVAQCDVARNTIEGVSSCSETQRPVLVFAGLVNLDVGTRLHVHAYNTNRETDQVIVWFRLRGRDTKCIWKMRLSQKSEVYEVVCALEPRLLGSEDLCRMARPVGPDRQIIDLPELPVAHRDYATIPLPDDPNVPLYVAIHDRAGSLSDYVPVHRLAQQKWK